MLQIVDPRLCFRKVFDILNAIYFVFFCDYVTNFALINNAYFVFFGEYVIIVMSLNFLDAFFFRNSFL